MPEFIERDCKLSSITVDANIQSRFKLYDEDTVELYRERVLEGDIFEPITVFDDGKTLWLSEGFQRLEAHRRGGRDTINCKIAQGTREDAAIFSLASNKVHGLPRTAQDKIHAIQKMSLARPEWSNNMMAMHLGVSRPSVIKYRIVPEDTVGESESESMYRRAGLNGRMYKLKRPKPIGNERPIGTLKMEPAIAVALQSRGVCTIADTIQLIDEGENFGLSNEQLQSLVVIVKPHRVELDPIGAETVITIGMIAAGRHQKWQDILRNIQTANQELRSEIGLVGGEHLRKASDASGGPLVTASNPIDNRETNYALISLELAIRQIQAFMPHPDYCGDCGGVGRINTHMCTTCRGAGFLPANRFKT